MDSLTVRCTMKFLSSFFIVTLMLLLSSCLMLVPIDWSDPHETQSRVKTRIDEFQKIAHYHGPNLLQSYNDWLFIRAWRELDSSKVTYQIYISDNHYGDWRFYDTAYDSDGKRLNLTSIDSDVSCYSSSCEFREDFGINVDREYLEKHLATGIRFQVSGKSGREVFSVLGSYINGFLSAIDQALAKEN